MSDAICAGTCHRLWDGESPFCPDCLAYIRHASLAGEVEVWIDIPGFEGQYRVSSFGQVQSLPRFVPVNSGTRTGGTTTRWCPGRIRLRQTALTNGYPAVRLTCKVPVPVHQIVALAFLGPRPEGLQVCHRDDIKTDNRIGVLRYDTPKANRRDAILNGRSGSRRRTHCNAGHEFTPENTIVHANGDRRCRTCKRRRQRARRDVTNAQQRERRAKNRDVINARQRERRAKRGTLPPPADNPPSTNPEPR